MLDFNKQIGYIFVNSYAHMIVKPLQLRLSGLNPNCVRSDNRDYNGFFVLSRVEQRYSTLRQQRYMSNQMIAERHGCNSPCQADALAEYSSAGIKET